MPSALQIMAKSAKEAGLAVDGTVKSMLALQQKGGLISSKVLPHFAKNLRIAAQNNKALDKALLSNRVAMNQMATSVQMTADTIFKSGWSEGLTDLFKSIGDLFKDNEVFFKSFGKIMGKVFKGVAYLIKNIVNPVFSAFGSILNMVTDAMDNFGDWVVLAFAPLAKYHPLLGGIIKRLGGVNMALRTMLGLAYRVLLPFTLLLGTLEEVAEFFSPTGKKTFLNANINDVLANMPEFMQTEQSKKVGDAGKGNKFMNTFLEALPAFTGYPMKMLLPDNNAQKQPVQIELKSDFYLDKEKMGSALSKTEAINSAIDYRSNNYGMNY